MTRIAPTAVKVLSPYRHPRAGGARAIFEVRLHTVGGCIFAGARLDSFAAAAKAARETLQRRVAP